MFVYNFTLCQELQGQFSLPFTNFCAPLDVILGALFILSRMNLHLQPHFPRYCATAVKKFKRHHHVFLGVRVGNHSPESQDYSPPTDLMLTLPSYSFLPVDFYLTGCCIHLEVKCTKEISCLYSQDLKQFYLGLETPLYSVSF